MAKSISKKTSEKEEVVNLEPATETPLAEVVVEEALASMPVNEELVEKVVEEVVSEKEKTLTETEFLQRILQIQREGGFGRHLDALIADRIKEINS